MLFSACTHCFYQPDRILRYPPEKFGYLQKDEFYFPSSDGTRLFAWSFPARTKPFKGTIVHFHGNAENISSHYLALVWLTDHGYDLFTFDYRGYGRSEGSPSQEGTYRDGVAALNKGYELHSKRKQESKATRAQFIVFGQSLGGAIAARAHQDFAAKDETTLLVLDSTFASYQEVAHQTLRHHWATWILSPLAYLLVSDSFSPESALRENRTPALVIHDTEDRAVPFASGKQVYDLLQSKKTLWTQQEATHISFFAPTNPDQRRRFVEFIDEL